MQNLLERSRSAGDGEAVDGLAAAPVPVYRR